MCRANTDPRGPKRCNNVKHLKALSIDDVTPESRADVPDLAWTDAERDLPALWREYADHPDFVAAGLAVLQGHVDVEPEVMTAMQQVVSGSGSRLTGLEYRLKSPASLVRKVVSKFALANRDAGVSDAESYAGRLNDVLRFTVETPEQDSITGALRTTVERLHGSGLRVMEIDNKYVEGNPYKGVHLKVAAAGGVLFEVQIHSSEGLRIKEQAHLHYELARDVNRSVVERQASEVLSRRLYDELPTPAGLEHVEQIDGIPVRKS